MNDDVYMIRTEPRYPDFPYEAEGNSLLQSLKALWTAQGRDPDNPFEAWLSPGGKALIKPNWVIDFNPISDDIESLITHASLIATAVEWSAIAMQGRGTVVIGDCPVQGCDFKNLLRRTRIEEAVERIRQKYPELEIRIEDWRLTFLERSGGPNPFKGNRQVNASDLDERMAREYELVDLGKESFLEDIAEFSDRFRVTCYKPSLMASHHRPGVHEYLVTKRVFGPDLVVNLPKMKTHIKAGLTGAMKNLVGINGHKEYLPHHIIGSYDEGGDCYNRANAFKRRYEQLSDFFWEQNTELHPVKRKSLSLFLGLLLRAARMGGADDNVAASWSGNETVWRMTLDLNHVMYFSPHSAKKIISIVDGVIGGEGEGPLQPRPNPAGVLVIGENPAYVDATLARLMGYNLSRLPTVYNAVYHRKSRLAGPSLEDFRVNVTDARGRSEAVPLHHLSPLPYNKPKLWKRAETYGNPAPHALPHLETAR